ncbi:hydrolase 1, exosortase A system-associated [Pseudomonadota bacterium]
MDIKEQAVVFECNGDRLIGVVHGAGSSKIGVLVVVGGPQYRIGSHRQFLLLARHLATNDVPVMRFDYRGMGDSEGDMRTFEDVGDDIQAAIDMFFQSSPGLSSVVLWGLCDAASAALFYAHSDPRVKGLVLLNPWVTTEAGEAKAYLRHYYFRRLFDKTLWKKALSGKFELRKSVASLLDILIKSRTPNAEPCSVEPSSVESRGNTDSNLSLPDRMYKGFSQFKGWVNVIISGEDLTAAEFNDLIKASSDWKNILESKEVQFHYLRDANHTFSSQAWRDEVAERTLRWVTSD